MSPGKSKGIKGMVESAGNLTLQIEWNQEDELPGGRVRMGEVVERKRDEWGDFGEISAAAEPAFAGEIGLARDMAAVRDRRGVIRPPANWGRIGFAFMGERERY